MKKKSAYLISGEDEFLVRSYAKQLVESLVPEKDRTFGLEVIDGAVDTVDESVEALKKVLEALQTVGFFGSEKTIWVRDALFFGKNSASNSPRVKDGVKALAGLVKQGLPEGQILVISTPKILKTTALYKAIKAKGDVKAFDVARKPHEQEKQSADRFEDVAARMGLTFSAAARAAFLAKAGADTRLIVSEMEKLFCYKGDAGPVTAADVEAITSAGKDAALWDLSDAFGARDLAKALAVLNQLLFQRESGVRLVLNLYARVNEMAMMREAMDRQWLRVSVNGRYTHVNWRESPEADIMLSALDRDPRSMHSYRQGLLAKQAMNFSLAELRRARYYALKAHEDLVSLTVPPATILETLLIRLLPARNRVQR